MWVLYSDKFKQVIVFIIHHKQYCLINDYIYYWYKGFIVILLYWKPMLQKFVAMAMAPYNTNRKGINTCRHSVFLIKFWAIYRSNKYQQMAISFQDFWLPFGNLYQWPNSRDIILFLTNLCISNIFRHITRMRAHVTTTRFFYVLHGEYIIKVLVFVVLRFTTENPISIQILKPKLYIIYVYMHTIVYMKLILNT